MSERSSIEWTEATWNPVRGCTKVSPGCKNCYAETFAERFRGVKGHAYEQGFDLCLVPEKLTEPLSWKKPRRVFVNSMSDLFQDGVPDEFIDQVFAVMALCSQHTFQVLTKRAERMRAYFGHHEDEPKDLRDRIDDAACEIAGACHANLDAPGRWPLPNVWLGVSVENQHFADERIPLLLQTPAAIRFISAEPLLGPVDLTNLDPDGTYAAMRAHGFSAIWKDNAIGRPWLDWVIVGGESGSGARPFDVAWARSIVRQCKAVGVPVFVKQLGAHVITRNDDGFEGDGVPKSWPMDTRTRDLTSQGWQGDPVRVFLRKKGGDPAAWPEDLRVREFPVGGGGER